MYRQYQGGGRPHEPSNRPISSDRYKLPDIIDIQNFAEDTDAWKGLGLDKIEKPRHIIYNYNLSGFLGRITYEDNLLELNPIAFGHSGERFLIAEFAQVYLMEMGNWREADKVRKICAQALDLDLIEFWHAQERLEFGVLFELFEYIDAENSPLQPSVWTARPRNFEEYLDLFDNNELQKREENFKEAWLVSRKKLQKEKK